MDKRWSVLGAVALTLVGTSPVAGQVRPWQQKWYWGAQGGGFAYQSAVTLKREYAISAGGHWLITGRRSALLFSIDQILFKDSSKALIGDATVASGVRVVDFSQGRRIQALVYAIPNDAFLQVMLGGGFAIHQILNAIPEGPFATPSEQATAENVLADVTTRAYAVMSAGFQFRFLPRWALFGSYQFMPGSKKFLIDSQQHVATAGLRFALTTSHEDVTTER